MSNYCSPADACLNFSDCDCLELNSLYSETLENIKYKITFGLRMWNDARIFFAIWGAHTTTSRFQFWFCCYLKVLYGADWLVKGVILQSICLFDTPVVWLLFRVRVSGSVNSFTGCISELLFEFFVHSQFIWVSSVLQHLEHCWWRLGSESYVGHVWNPCHILEYSGGSQLWDFFSVWFKRVPRAWSVIFVWEVIVSTWYFCYCSERQHCRVSSAYQLVSCPSWGFGLHHSQS